VIVTLTAPQLSKLPSFTEAAVIEAVPLASMATVIFLHFATGGTLSVAPTTTGAEVLVHPNWLVTVTK